MAHAYSTDKNINELVKLIVKTQGVTLKNGGKHLAMLLPDGNKLPIPGTPGDRRSYLNFRAQVRRLFPELDF